MNDNYPARDSNSTAFNLLFLVQISSFVNMSEPKIEHWDEAKEGVLNAENMMNKLQKEGYSCTQYTFTPGTTFPDHSHGVSKKDAIISGEFQFTIYGKTIVLHPGDTVEVPKGTVHSAEVVGKNSVVFIDAS